MEEEERREENIGGCSKAEDPARIPPPFIPSFCGPCVALGISRHLPRKRIDARNGARTKEIPLSQGENCGSVQIQRRTHIIVGRMIDAAWLKRRLAQTA